MGWLASLLIIISGYATANTISPNEFIKNKDVPVSTKGVLPIQGSNYSYELGKGPNDTQVVSSKIQGLYSLAVKRENNEVASTTETIKESSDIYATKHVVFDSQKNGFFMTNCRGKKGKVFNDVVCNSINTQICSSYLKLKDYDKDLFAKVNSCIDIEKKIDAFKDSYRKETESKEFKEKHLLGREEGRAALNKYANVISITDVFNREMGKNLDKDGILEASWKEVNRLVKDCPGVSEKDYSINNIGNGFGSRSFGAPFPPIGEPNTAAQ